MAFFSLSLFFSFSKVKVKKKKKKKRERRTTRNILEAQYLNCSEARGLSLSSRPRKSKRSIKLYITSTKVYCLANEPCSSLLPSYVFFSFDIGIALDSFNSLLCNREFCTTLLTFGTISNLFEPHLFYILHRSNHINDQVE